MAIPRGHKANLRTLVAAVRNGDVALMECQDKKSGMPCVVLVAVNRPRVPGEDYQFTPLARFFDGNPYEELNPPDPSNTHGFITT